MMTTMDPETVRLAEDSARLRRYGRRYIHSREWQTLRRRLGLKPSDGRLHACAEGDRDEVSQAG